jgi:CBS domain-containing protein
LAGSGEEAIEMLNENPDVVILDIKMPGMDGHQALQEIKKRSPDLPIIMLTGHGAMPSAREALVEHGKKEWPPEEKSVMDVMIPLKEYTTLKGEQTVKEAIFSLKASFALKISTGRIMETGHRSILVFDDRGKVQGLLAIVDLLEGIMPAYLGAPKPSMADSIQFSPMFWMGMFTRQVEELGKKKIKDIMSPPPLTIDGDSNLMEAAGMMFENRARRLAVARSGEIVGVIREQELFFEMEKTLRS